MKSNLLVIMLMLGFLACDKQNIVEEDLNGFDVQVLRNGIKTEKEIIEVTETVNKRIRESTDPKNEIRKLNESIGRYVDEKGDIYLNTSQYKEIQSSRNNARSAIDYNEWHVGPTGAIWNATVWYWDNGSYHVLAWLENSSAFVTCPTGWSLCSTYNGYFVQMGNITQSNCSPAPCCGDVVARMWNGSTLKDEDTWHGEYTLHGTNDSWYARIKDYTPSGLYKKEFQVLNGGCNGSGSANCGYSQ